jgi:hypothetical protein
MTVGKAGLLTAGLVGMFSLGVLTGPTIRHSWSTMNEPQATVAAPADESSTPAPVKAERPRPRARTASSARPHEAVATKESAETANTARTIPVSQWQPELRDRVKSVLNPGARLEIAAADFGDSEQFITVAHAARNTKVPFMVLKDRVVNQRQPLADAIREFKPELDAKAEVTRARAEARSDLAIAG